MNKVLIPNHKACYVCGDQNHRGLKHRFWLEGGHVVTTIEQREDYIGHGFIHGGISAALLDEAMALSATIAKERLCVTAEFTVRYLKPMSANGTYLVKGRLLSDRKILCITFGEVSDMNNEIYVKATGKYVPVSKEESDRIHNNAPDV
ncbi:MAG: PaaI family thioesterase [Spirochaetes bacterium]|nr:PaaI family thioesterase [Spirochaetota bacterium]